MKNTIRKKITMILSYGSLDTLVDNGIINYRFTFNKQYNEVYSFNCLYSNNLDNTINLVYEEIINQ